MGYDKHTYEKDKKAREIALLEKYLSKQRTRKLNRLRALKSEGLESFCHLGWKEIRAHEDFSTSLDCKPSGKADNSERLTFEESLEAGESLLDCWLKKLPKTFDSLEVENLSKAESMSDESADKDTEEARTGSIGFGGSNLSQLQLTNEDEMEVEKEIGYETTKDEGSFDAIMIENLQKTKDFLEAENDGSLVQDVCDFIKLSNNTYTMSTGLQGSFTSHQRCRYFQARDNSRMKVMVNVFKNKTVTTEFSNVVYALKGLMNVENVQRYIGCRELRNHSFLVKERMSSSLKEILSKNIVTGPFTTAVDASTNGSVNHFLNLFYQMFEGVTEMHQNRKSEHVF